MFKIDTLDADTILPTPKPVGVNVDGFFSSGDIGTGTPPTRLTHDVLNALQEEICYVITSAGFTLDKSDHTQLYQALQSMAPAALTAVVNDTTPALGGNLDVNGHLITSATDLNVTATTTLNLAADMVLLGGFPATLQTDATNYMVIGPDSFQAIIASIDMLLESAGFSINGAAEVTSISTDATMAANSATLLTTQAATKSYIDSSLLAREEYQLYIPMALNSLSSTVTTMRIPTPTISGNYEIGQFFFCAEHANTSVSVPYQVSAFVFDATNSTASVAIHANIGTGSYISNTASWELYQSGFTLPGVAFYLQLWSSDTTAPGNVMVHVSIRRVI